MRVKLATFSLLWLIALSLSPLSVASVHAQTSSYKLLFSNSNIFTINADGTDLTQLTSGTITKSNPTWSADGTYIAYIYNPEGIGAAPEHFAYRRSEDLNQLWVMNSDGGNKQLIASRSARFQWSPTDHRLAYFDNSFTDSDQNGLWVLDLATQHQIKITDLGISGFAWSPDGKFLVTTTGVMGEGPDSYFNGVLLDIFDSETTKGSYSQQIECADCSPVWSPDGSHILLKNWQTMMILTDTGELIFQIDGSDPDWSPDGRQVALIISGDLQLITLPPEHDPEFWRVHRLSYEALYTPKWSPDNLNIVYIGSTENWEASIRWGFYVIKRVEDNYALWRQPSVLSGDNAEDEMIGPYPRPFAWSSDGRYIAWAFSHPSQRGVHGIRVIDVVTGSQDILVPEIDAMEISWQPIPRS